MRRLLAGMVGLFLAASTACPTYADDSTIAQQLATELRAAKTNRDLQSFRINVKVEDGVVWMQGSVADVEQRSKALNIARAVSGVRLVVNDLALSDDVVPDVAPPQDKRPAATIVAKPAAKVNEDKTPVAETSVKPVAAYQAQVKPSQGNAVVSPAAAMAGPVRPNMPAPAMTQPLRSQLTPQLMQAQLIQTQMLQRELAESKAIAAATEQLRRQNAIARNQLVNYCGGSGCNAGRNYPTSGGPSYGGECGGECGDGYGGGYAGGSYGGYGGEYGGSFGGESGGAGVVYDQAQLPSYAWPSYASYPNYAALSYPKQYSAQAWPYIGPFYPYPQVPLGWRKVCLEWDDGWWMLDFTSKCQH